MTKNNAALTPSGGSFIGIATQPGVSTGNMLTFYLACYATIMFATFIPQTQPFLLNEVLVSTPRNRALSAAT